MPFTNIFQRTIGLLNHRLPSRRFIAVFGVLSALFLLFHAVIWFGFTKTLLKPPATYHTGDLARVGYIPELGHTKHNQTLLPRRHMKTGEWDGRPVDLITIGDSFSNGGAGGLNSYYQDYITSGSNLRVMHINAFESPENYIETAMALINSGMINQLKPKAIIIESTQRFCIDRFTPPVRWDSNLSQEAIRQSIMTNNIYTRYHYLDIGFINTANYKFLLWSLLYRFSPNAFGASPTYRLQMDRPLFSVGTGKELLVHNTDITRLPRATPDNVEKLNANFNRLQGYLAPFGITLYLMVVVDKYDLYHDFIRENPFRENPFFDLLRRQKRHYRLIDTKAILEPLARNGVKDLFYVDDTHWSYKASETVIASFLHDYEDNQTDSDNHNTSISRYPVQ